MTAAPARQLAQPPSEARLLEDARDVIAVLVDELLTFKAQSSPHKALRSRYSRKGVCETTDGCSPLCVAWVEAIETGAGWIAAYDAREG